MIDEAKSAAGMAMTDARLAMEKVNDVIERMDEIAEVLEEREEQMDSVLNFQKGLEAELGADGELFAQVKAEIEKVSGKLEGAITMMKDDLFPRILARVIVPKSEIANSAQFQIWPDFFRTSLVARPKRSTSTREAEMNI